VTAADGWTIGLAILLVAVAGVLAGIEVAFSRVSRVRAEELAREDGRAAQRLLDVTANRLSEEDERLLRVDVPIQRDLRLHAAVMSRWLL